MPQSDPPTNTPHQHQPTLHTTTPHHHTPPPTNIHHTPTTTPQGYATLPLPTLRNTDIRLISHNINTLHTTTTPELEATIASYQAFDPTILGLQETNKNWTQYDKTELPLRTTLH
jgi:hypothetical protein